VKATEAQRRKMVEARAKKKSKGRGRMAGEALARRRARARRRKRKSVAANWRERRRWTGVAHCGHFLPRLFKNCGGMLYFPSWLYNRDGSFNTFYRGWIYRNSRVAIVSLV